MMFSNGNGGTGNNFGENGTQTGSPNTNTEINPDVGNSTEGSVKGSLDGLTSDEIKMVNDLVSDGNVVEIIPRSDIPGVKTPDFKINATVTELKTLNGTSLNTPVSKIQNAFKQGAETVIVDGRKSGLTSEQAQTVISRINGVYNNNVPGKIEIWTTGGKILGGK